MIGVEFDLVVSDSLAALEQYESVFEVERLEVTDFDPGQNEAVFTMYGGRFHLLDANPEFQLFAPQPGQVASVWANLLVDDIHQVYDKAMDAGWAALQPVTELADFGVSNAVVADTFGHSWMLHQIHRVVSFEDRMKLYES